MITCKEVVEIITDCMEGALPPAQHEEVMRHLAACKSCNEYAEQISFTIRAVGHLREDDLPSAVREELVYLFRNWKRKKFTDGA